MRTRGWGHRCGGRRPTARSICAAVCVATMGGCGVGPPPTDGVGASAYLDAATVVKAVYELEGEDRRVLFVDVDGCSDEVLDATLRRLADELPVDVLRGDQAELTDPSRPALTPLHPETGETGLFVRVVTIERTGPREAEAYVRFSRSGLSGGDLMLTFDQTAGGWKLTGHDRTAQA